MTLYLIRHARAEERGPKHPDDSRRPLTPKGQAQAKSLAKALDRLEIQFDKLFSSPYTRAAQTAEPLGKRLRKGKIAYLETLTDERYPQLLVDIKDRLADEGAADDTCVGLVGHEPFLSELSSYLLTGDDHSLDVTFKKAAVLTLTGSLAKGSMTLQSFLPYSAYRHFSS